MFISFLINYNISIKKITLINNGSNYNSFDYNSNYNHIDHIFCSKSMVIIETIEDSIFSNLEYPSDHNAIISVIGYRE